MDSQNDTAGSGPLDGPVRPVAEALRRAVARTTRLNAEVALLCEAGLRGAQEIDRLREALREIQSIALLPREPAWAYRNTITTNKDRIKALCAAALGA